MKKLLLVVCFLMGIVSIAFSEEVKKSEYVWLDEKPTFFRQVGNQLVYITREESEKNYLEYRERRKQ